MINETVKDPAINQAVLTIKKLTAREEMQLEAINREKAERDRISIIAYERAEARAEERVKLAANLRAMGMSEEQIKLALNGPAAAKTEENSGD